MDPSPQIPPTAAKAGAVVHAMLRAAIIIAVLLPARLGAQTASLTIAGARELAHRSSPAVAAARAAVEAAAALERQARAYANPTLSYSRERTSAVAQDIAAVEQRVEIGGQRGARAAAARLRREAAQARLAAAEAAVDLEITRAYATVLTADQRALLAAAAAEQFRTATALMNRRLAEGDVSGYAARRVQLEAARYQAMAAEAALARTDARLRLFSRLGSTADTLLAPISIVVGSAATLALTRDSLVALALVHNAELRAATLTAQAASADIDVTRRDRIPTPALAAGLKRENTSAANATGFVLGFSVPLPVWDRREGAIDAAAAESRRLLAERSVIARRIAQETASAAVAVQQTDAQVAALSAVLGEHARVALRAAETAFNEGEITLVEWLDAVRAYQEAESAFAAVLGQAFSQRAVLERLLGIPLIR